ncbi:MAG: peptide ABC transporter substrate-binding protein [Veillonellales bacterium]
MRIRTIFMLAILLVNIVLMTGCGQKALPQNPAKEIKTGGQLTFGSLQEPNTLNPLLSDVLATAEVSSLIFSGLVITNDKGEWIPDLALDIPTVQNGGVSPDGRTITYRLHQGVSWHDGAPFTAADVKFTWQIIMNRKVNIVQREGYDKIASIDTPDPYTVVIHFREYYAPYLTLFSTILPQHLLGAEEDINKASFNRAPVGTGPFKFKEWRVAEAVVLEANPAYFRGKPKLDGIIYKVIPDPNVLLTQLKAGEVDLVTNIHFAQLDQVKTVAGMNTVITPNMIWEHLDYNLDTPIFQDVRVRQAIVLALDRRAIISSVLKSAASPAAADQSPLSWAYNPTLQPASRDINAAKELLTEAGWSQGADGIFSKDGKKLSFTLTTTAGNKIRELVAQTIAQQLKEAGIGVEIRPVETAAFFADILKNRRFDMAMYAWVGGVDPDNIDLWHSKRIPTRSNGYDGHNFPGWHNSEVDNLTEKGIATVDIEARKQIYFRIQELIIQECPVVPLYFRVNIDVVKKTVANYRPNPTPAGNLWNAWEWGFYTN